MDTQAIQAQIDAASDPSSVVVPSGTYDVDAVNAPITLKTGITLDLTSGAVLRCIPNAEQTTRIVRMKGVTRCALLGGNVVGDRDKHIGAAGEWGLGVDISGGSSSCTVRGTRIEACWGDGIFLDGVKDIVVDGVVSDRNRRQGMSVIDIDGLEVNNSYFINTGGTRPGAGIDFEPDSPGLQSIRNVRIRGSVFSGNAGAGVLIACPPGSRSNISIDGTNRFDGQPIDGTDGIVPFYARWMHQITGKWWGYPHTLSIP